MTRKLFHAVILAGDRTRQDALREYSGVSCKALIRVAGVPMVHRVIGALRGAGNIARIGLSGPESQDVQSDAELSEWVASGTIDWSPPQGSPSTSAYQAMQALPDDVPVLITTADHPLLSSEIVDRFCDDSRASECDVLVGLAPHDLILRSYPGIRKTVLKFRDNEYCGCNLFAFMSPRGRGVADFWRRIENERKKPLLLIGLLGIFAVLRYRMGWLSLDSALKLLSKRLDLRVGAVILPYADAAIDVDSVADYRLVREHTEPAAQDAAREP